MKTAGATFPFVRGRTVETPTFRLGPLSSLWFVKAYATARNRSALQLPNEKDELTMWRRRRIDYRTSSPRISVDLPLLDPPALREMEGQLSHLPLLISFHGSWWITCFVN